MRKIISILLAVIMLILPIIPETTYATTGHINGCTNIGSETECCTKTFNIIPDEGYEIVDVLVNGVSQGGPITSYTFTNIIGPQTLEVITRKIGNTTYTVSYNTNGGSSAPASQSKTHGESITLSDATPTKANCIFLGWAKSATATTAQYEKGAIYTDEGDVTLYAVWEDLTKIVPEFSYSTGTENWELTDEGLDAFGVRNWQIKIKADGVLTFSKVVDEVDIFLVGGGGGGNPQVSPGGGGGYTTTIRNISVSERVGYTIDIGNGGAANVTDSTGNGKSTSISEIDGATAAGGYSGYNGGHGGSAGGPSVKGAAGKSDGEKCSDSCTICQGTTTSEFGEGGTLYSGGGAGSNNQWGNPGGAGGGGGSGANPTPNAPYPGTAGATNTGGGGGSGYKSDNETVCNYGGSGGSGVVIIRNARATNTQTTYTVTYNTNGGTDAPGTQDKTHGVNLTLSDITPTREGYEFVCWNTASDGNGTDYSSGATYGEDANLTLYAKWTANTYTINYNTNGGNPTPSSQTKTHGKNITLSDVTPTKANCSFLGWAKSDTATTAEYASKATYTEDGNVTLYAVWEDIVPGFSYSGESEIITNGTDWKIKFKTSGNLIFNENPGNIDLFLVGGGGAGGAGAGLNGGCGGGGGGYTTLATNISVISVGTSYYIQVGDGGVNGVTNGEGQKSSAFTIEADGGQGGADGAVCTAGGAGGSGGGCGADGVTSGSLHSGTQGSSNGQNIWGCGTSPGVSTYEFREESSGILYSGGGGGGGSSNETYGGGSGGAGGGGRGGDTSHSPEAGATNTGGGGGGGSYNKPGANGGSGIVIIRNAR